MATLILYPSADISVNHTSTRENGYSVLRDTNDATYISQFVDNTDFVNMNSSFTFDGYTLKNATINSVTAIVRARVTSNDGVNFARMTVAGTNTSKNYLSTPNYDTFGNCSFALTVGDIGLASATITAQETYNNLSFSLESRIKKTAKSKNDFEL